jgi:hypothetical protein
MPKLTINQMRKKNTCQMEGKNNKGYGAREEHNIARQLGSI